MGKKIIGLALAGISWMACGQAQAAQLFEIEAFGPLTYTSSSAYPPNYVPSYWSYTYQGAIKGVFDLTTKTGKLYGALGPGGSEFDATITFNGNVMNIWSNWVPIGAANSFSLSFEYASLLGGYPPQVGAYPISGSLNASSSGHYGTNSLRGPLTLTYATGSVPEPATWAMMIAGFGLAGGMMRRRRMTAVYA